MLSEQQTFEDRRDGMVSILCPNQACQKLVARIPEQRVEGKTAIMRCLECGASFDYDHPS
jgi:hypothetical protein